MTCLSPGSFNRRAPTIPTGLATTRTQIRVGEDYPGNTCRALRLRPVVQWGCRLHSSSVSAQARSLSKADTAQRKARSFASEYYHQVGAVGRFHEIGSGRWMPRMDDKIDGPRLDL